MLIHVFSCTLLIQWYSVSFDHVDGISITCSYVWEWMFWDFGNIQELFHHNLTLCAECFIRNVLMYTYVHVSYVSCFIFPSLETTTIRYSGNVCISFLYHMRVSGRSRLEVRTRTSGQAVWQRSGSQGDDWKRASIDTRVQSGQKVSCFREYFPPPPKKKKNKKKKHLLSDQSGSYMYMYFRGIYAWVKIESTESCEPGFLVNLSSEPTKFLSCESRSAHLIKSN